MATRCSTSRSYGAKRGLVFSELQEPVKTGFVLVDSADERN